ncbi:hypothetical protein C8F01DRAFT_199833 [Mycena amicta]|nr:hypothetical protein C8F01DRAFT_199833 [Mycena amicta]
MDRNDLLQYEPLALIIHRMSPSPSPNRAIIYSCICKALDVTFVETHSDRINSLATEPTVSGSESAVVISALFGNPPSALSSTCHSEKSAWTEQVRALIRDVVADKPITPNPKTNELYEATCFFLPAIHFLLEPALKTSVNPAGLAAYLSHPDFLALVNRQHTAHALPPANFQEDILAGRRLPFPPYTAVRPLTQAEIATVNESNLPSALLLQLQDDHEQLDFHERVARELALEADNDARWDLVSSHIYREERKLPRLEVLPREIFSIICLSRFAKAYKRNDFLAAQEAMVAFLSIFSTANYRNVLNVFESVRRSTLDPELQEFLDELVPPEIRNTVLLSANTRFEFEHPELMAYIQQHSSHTTHKPLSYAKIFTDAYVQEGAPSFPAWYAERVRHGATEIKIGSTTFLCEILGG